MPARDNRWARTCNSAKVDSPAGRTCPLSWRDQSKHRSRYSRRSPPASASSCPPSPADEAPAPADDQQPEDDRLRSRSLSRARRVDQDSGPSAISGLSVVASQASNVPAGQRPPAARRNRADPEPGLRWQSQWRAPSPPAKTPKGRFWIGNAPPGRLAESYPALPLRIMCSIHGYIYGIGLPVKCFLSVCHT